MAQPCNLSNNRHGADLLRFQASSLYKHHISGHRRNDRIMDPGQLFKAKGSFCYPGNGLSFNVAAGHHSQCLGLPRKK